MEIHPSELPEGVGLTFNEHYRVYEHRRGGLSVYFSASRVGEAMIIHIACSRRSICNTRKAASDFVEFIFDRFQWCRVVLGTIVKPSVLNLANKCGFEEIGSALMEGGSMSKIVARFR